MEYLQSIIIYLCTVNKVFYRLQSTFLYWLGQGSVEIVWAALTTIYVLEPWDQRSWDLTWVAGSVVEQDSVQLLRSLGAGYGKELPGLLTLRHRFWGQFYQSSAWGLWGFVVDRLAESVCHFKPCDHTSFWLLGPAQLFHKICGIVRTELG